MNKLSENEIIAILEELWFDCNEFGVRNLITMYPEADVPYLVEQAIQGILDLYKEEKEKNAEIKSKDYKGLIEDFEHGLYMSKFDVEENYVREEKYYELKKELEAEKEKNKESERKLKIANQLYDDACISIATECVLKDKIKAKIEELEAVINEFYNSSGNLTISDEFQYKIDVLQELLEEGEIND